MKHEIKTGTTFEQIFTYRNALREFVKDAEKKNLKKLHTELIKIENECVLMAKHSTWMWQGKSDKLYIVFDGSGQKAIKGIKGEYNNLELLQADLGINQYELDRMLYNKDAYYRHDRYVIEQHENY